MTSKAASVWLLLLKEGGDWTAKQIAKRLGLNSRTQVAPTLQRMADFNEVRKFFAAEGRERRKFRVDAECIVPRDVRVEELIAHGIDRLGRRT